MADPISKVQRWLDLISFLVGHRYPVEVDRVMRGVPAYAERWFGGSDRDRDSVRRMFERDKDELRELGMPIETVEYRLGLERMEGYRLSRRDFYLPYLRLLRRSDEPDDSDASDASDDEGSRGGRPGRHPDLPVFEVEAEDAALAMEALDHVLDREAFPLREEARAARRKLTFDLDAFGGTDERDIEGPNRTPMLWIDPPGARERAETLDALSGALLRLKRVRFTYHGMSRDERSRREVEPWGLLFQHTHWYLVGRDTGREARRTFRIARISELEVNDRSPSTADYEIPGDFDLADLRSREAWELGEEGVVEARVRFDFPRSLWAERNRMGTLVRREVEGAQVRSFQVLQTDPFLRWILSLAGEARILEPPELVRALQEMAGRVVDLYRSRTDG